jgi:hypothetical protein
VHRLERIAHFVGAQDFTGAVHHPTSARYNRTTPTGHFTMDPSQIVWPSTTRNADHP